MIRFLVISSFLLLFFSCKTYELKNVEQKVTENTTFKNVYFADAETDYVYKANIEVYDKNVGGIFIAKKINDTLHRVVFTTDFGNKLLDFELSENEFKVNYIVEDLDKNIIKRILKEDFRLLLKINHEIAATFQNQDFSIYKANDLKRFNYFYVSKKDNKLLKLVNTSKRKEKVTFEFDSENSTFAKNITITHHNFKLKIKLNQLNN